MGFSVVLLLCCLLLAGCSTEDAIEAGTGIRVEKVEDIPYGISDADLERVDAAFDDMLIAAEEGQSASTEISKYENAAAIRNVKSANDSYGEASKDIADVEGELLRDWLAELVSLNTEAVGYLEDAAAASTAKDKDRYLAAFDDLEQSQVDLKKHLKSTFAKRLFLNEDFMDLMQRYQGQD